MADDWESAENSELVIRPTIPLDMNKWAGEDEPEDVKECWEDEEEKKDEEKLETKGPVNTKLSKSTKSKFIQIQNDEDERYESMTPEEKIAEKLRLQKIQEESDLKTALETLGISANGLDNFNPKSKEEFKEFGTTLSWKLSLYKDSPHFPQFIEDLVRSICTNLTIADLKKVKMTVESLHSEKLKLEKQNAKKGPTKSKIKATIRADKNDIDDFLKYGNDYDEFDDDFM